MVDQLPDWWQPLAARAAEAVTADFTRWPTPADGGRPSAVLVLLGEGGADHRPEAPAGGPDRRPGRAAGPGPGSPGPDRIGGPEVLLLERAATMRTHAGQVAFPGGAADPGDRDPAATALREASEEVGLDPASVTVVTELPRLWIPVSGFVVTPVLAWWHAPHPVYPRATHEVSRVARLPVRELVAPDNRLRVRHPSGYVGPAFTVDGLLVWGFTAGVLATLFELAGWARPWPQDRVADLPGLHARPVP